MRVRWPMPVNGIDLSCPRKVVSILDWSWRIWRFTLFCLTGSLGDLKPSGIVGIDCV